jgi:hypothetical protein
MNLDEENPILKTAGKHADALACYYANIHPDAGSMSGSWSWHWAQVPLLLPNSSQAYESGSPVICSIANDTRKLRISLTQNIVCYLGAQVDQAPTQNDL